MTKLTAVNQILEESGNGGFPILALDTNGRSETAKAERVLERENVLVQTDGWVFNTRYNVELIPDTVTGKITFSNSIISIDSDGVDSERNITQRGGYLYDLDNNTDVFTGSRRVTYVEMYNFDCIPEPVAAYIAAKATLAYTENMPTQNMIRIRTLRDKVDRCLGAAKAFNCGVSDSNILRNPEAQRLRGNTGFGVRLGSWLRFRYGGS